MPTTPEPMSVATDVQDIYSAIPASGAKFDLSSPAAVEAHGECDARLAQRIEDTLAPLIGSPGIAQGQWFQSLDFYGDGVRLIESPPGMLSGQVLATLRALLEGEHSAFSILWKYVAPSGDGAPATTGAALITKGRVTVTHSMLSNGGKLA